MYCKKCDHEWVSIVEKPLKCPACNQPKYWLPKVRNIEGKSEASGKTESRGSSGQNRPPTVSLSKINNGSQVSEVGDGEASYEKDDWSQA